MDSTLSLLERAKAELIGFVVGGANGMPQELLVPDKDLKMNNFITAISKFLEVIHIQDASISVDSIDDYCRMVITSSNGFDIMSKYMSASSLQVGVMCWLAMLANDHLCELVAEFHTEIIGIFGLERANEELLSVMIECINGVSVVVEERLNA